MSVNSDTPNAGIFTLWFSCNYGAILTTFALYRLLEQEGCRPLVLDQAPITGNCEWNKASNISRAFMARHGLQCSKPLSTDTDLQQLNEQLQTFIVGSDQVWRWRYTQAYGLLHFLDFVRGDKRKIAVSSSFGIDKEERPTDMVRKAGYYLRSFDAVSVREESGLELLRRHYGVEGEWIPDPVFLCNRECYDELLKDTVVPQKPYLLSYVLEPDEKIRHIIETLALERGLEVINMVDAQGNFEQLRARFGGVGNIAQGVSPEQWLAYIRHCAYFVTDSFHGVCFAHIYRRDFVCVAPPERGLTRFTSLLGLTGLQRCMLAPDYSPADWQAATAPIDWSRTQTLLDEACTKGNAWLRQALSSCRSTQRQAQAEMVYELLYAGNGEMERYREQEEQVQQELIKYRIGLLPLFIRLKLFLYQVLCRLPLPSTWHRNVSGKRQALRQLRAYLNISAASKAPAAADSWQKSADS